MTNLNLMAKFCIVKVESVYERDRELVALREEATQFFPHLVLAPATGGGRS